MLILLLGKRVGVLAFNQLNQFVPTAASYSTLNVVNLENAKPYKEIPGPTKFGLMRAFAPGGKYKDLNIVDLSFSMMEEYGNLAKFPGLFGQKDLIFTFDPNDMETAFRNEGKFPQRRGLDSLVYFRETYKKNWFEKGAGLVPTQGHEWYDFRTKVNQTMLQPKNAKLYIPQIDEVVSELVLKTKQGLNEKNETPENFLDFLNEWALESIGLITLDKRLGVLQNPKSSELNRLMKDVIQLSFEYDIQPSLWRTFQTPGFKNVMRTYEKLTGLMKDHVEEAMKKLENIQPSSDHEAGLLEKLMRIDKHVAFVMVLDSLIAGVDTTTAGLVTTLYHLAKNPDKQEILRQEIFKILPDKNSKLTTQSLNSVPYLKAVIKEAIRLVQPINGNVRVTTQDMVIQGYHIPKDVSMFLASHVTSLKDEIFPRSREFIPERWLKDNDDPKCPHAKDSHPFAYLPFGFGPRMCIGRRFAELEIEVLTLRMIREFKLEWNRPDLKFKSLAFTTPADPLVFKVTEVEN